MSGDGMGAHREEAEYHVEEANALLAELKHGGPGHGSYAASATTKAIAAGAHVALARWHDARAREQEFHEREER